MFFENEFHHAFLYKNCAGCAIHKLHLAVPVAIRKSQLAVRKKSFEKDVHKMLMKMTQGLLFAVSIRQKEKSFHDTQHNDIQYNNTTHDK